MMNLRSDKVSSKTRGAKRKKDDQDTFSTPQKPRKKQHTSGEFGFYEMLADNTTSFIDDTGNKVPLKTTMLFNTDYLNITNSTKEKLIPQLLKNECKTIDSYSPLKQVYYSQNGSPESGVTHSGTRMTVRDRLGLVTVFDNRNPITPEKSPKLKKDFENDPIVKGIVSPPLDSKKTASYSLTRQKLSKVEKEKRNSKKRIISQNRAMTRPSYSDKDGSGTLYADACLERTPKKTSHKRKKKPLAYLSDIDHWCHLEPYSFGGGKTQNKNNLVLGPAALNWLQILIDAMSKRLVKKHKYPKAECKILVPVINGTHIATGLLEQEIKTGSFETFYQLPTTKKHMPLHVTREYITKAIDAIVAADKSTPPPKTPQKDSFILTFSKFTNKTPSGNSSLSKFKSARRLKF